MWDAYRGVKLGVIKGEGSHLRVPFFQKPIIVDIRSTPTEINTDTGSKGTYHHFLFIEIIPLYISLRSPDRQPFTQNSPSSSD